MWEGRCPSADRPADEVALESVLQPCQLLFKPVHSLPIQLLRVLMSFGTGFGAKPAFGGGFGSAPGAVRFNRCGRSSGCLRHSPHRQPIPSRYAPLRVPGGVTSRSVSHEYAGSPTPMSPPQFGTTQPAAGGGLFGGQPAAAPSAFGSSAFGAPKVAAPGGCAYTRHPFAHFAAV